MHTKQHYRKIYQQIKYQHIQPQLVHVFPSFLKKGMHVTCLLRNLHTGQEATVRTGHRTDWFQKGKGVRQAVYCHPAYLTSMQSTS